MAKLHTSRVGPSTCGDCELKVWEFTKVFDHCRCARHFPATMWVRGQSRRKDAQKAVSHRGEAGWALGNSMAFEDLAQDPGIRWIPVAGPFRIDWYRQLCRHGALVAEGVYGGAASERAVDIKDDQTHVLAG